MYVVVLISLQILLLVYFSVFRIAFVDLIENKCW